MRRLTHTGTALAAFLWCCSPALAERPISQPHAQPVPATVAQSAAHSPAQRASLSAALALARLATGKLEAVVVNGDLDLTSLVPAADVDALHIRDADIQGALVGPVTLPLSIDGVRMDELLGAHANWESPLALRAVTIRRRVDLQHANLAAFSCRHPCTLGRYVDFSGARVDGPFRLEARLHERALALFVDTDFRDEAHFAQTRFGHRTGFTQARFAALASFARVHSPGRMVFAGAEFKQRLSFRDCRVEDLAFSLPPTPNSSASAAFSPYATLLGAADFRRCRFGKLVLDDADIRAGIDLRLAAFGAGGLSAVNLSAPDGGIDLRGARWQGPFRVASAELVQFKLTWPDPEPWLRFVQTGRDFVPTERDRADTLEGSAGARVGSARDYRNLAAYLRDHGEPIPAQRAEYQQKAREWQQLASGSDDAALVTLEWLLWTWPTGNGTSLSMLVVLATLLVAFGSVLLWPERRRLVVLPPSGKSTVRDWREVGAAELPQGAFAPIRTLDQLRLTALFAFRLAYFLTPGEYRYVSERHRLDVSAQSLLRWFIWITGKWLLALAAVTIANRSPALRAILPFD